ncbi:Zinc/iron permease [Exophiala viscosa]|uniref:Zinc/iron permease n=1 Tax=Exophiala viscosa TaxID=2486360 RepID=UPI00219EFC92|nr:Zinc/iron permease [Exophiala viscosa]
MPSASSLDVRDFDVTLLPLELLHAELSRRQDEKPVCGSTGNHGTYNTGLHVLAIFIILGLSTLACSFPIIARRFPNLPIPHRFLFLSRHFGTGVLIATAFVHLLPTAFISMTDPCLPDFWSRHYRPMPGFIAMLAVFVVVAIEMVFASKGAGHSHSTEWEGTGDARRPVNMRGGESSHENGHISLNQLGTPITPYTDSGPRPRNSTSDHSDSEDDLDELDPMADESATLNHPHKRKISEFDDHQLRRHATPSDENPQRLFLQCLLLEAGILFHSIFIGMAVSVATGTQFVVLLIAICFHQTFEGFALGARIAALIPKLFDASSPKPWLMALAYGATTPIGQALGIWIRELYDPASKVGLLMVGITNAISSGLLLFAGLVQLIAEDFLSERSYDSLKGWRRIEACLAVGLGALLMAIVGAFA